MRAEETRTHRAAVEKGSKDGCECRAEKKSSSGLTLMRADLGLDDNLTLPILSGALIWLWLGMTNVVASVFGLRA